MLSTIRRFLAVLGGRMGTFVPARLVPCGVRHGGTRVAIPGMRRARRTRGTSLVDIMVGIAISAVLIGIAVPTIPSLMDPYRLSFAARALGSEMSTARMRSIAQNRRHRVIFDVTGRTYQLQEETAANTWTAVGGSRELPTGCTFGEIPSNPTFDTRGMLAQSYDIAVHSAAQTRTVSVNILGNVQIHAS